MNHTDEQLLDLAAEHDWDPGEAIWLPRPGRDEERCEDSRERVGDPERCHLVAGHPIDHHDARTNVSWSRGWTHYLESNQS